MSPEFVSCLWRKRVRKGRARERAKASQWKFKFQLSHLRASSACRARTCSTLTSAVSTKWSSDFDEKTRPLSARYFYSPLLNFYPGKLVIFFHCSKKIFNVMKFLVARTEAFFSLKKACAIWFGRWHNRPIIASTTKSQGNLATYLVSAELCVVVNRPLSASADIRVSRV